VCARAAPNRLGADRVAEAPRQRDVEPLVSPAPETAALISTVPPQIKVLHSPSVVYCMPCSRLRVSAPGRRPQSPAVGSIKALTMSWKATAFVKDLRENLTVPEKFVLLILADYHRSDDKVAWPSVSTLAYDCLMEERSVSRILSRLEEKQFIRRLAGCGRGKMSVYQFIGLDVKDDSGTPIVESGFGQSVITKPPIGVSTAHKPRPTSTRNKVLQVEPLKQPQSETRCSKCNGTKLLHQLPHIPGPRLIPCNACSAEASA
jgi:hypothetical protein